MERDGVTRVFAVACDHSKATETFPSHGGVFPQPVLARTDFFCLNYEVYERLPNGDWGSLLESEWVVRNGPSTERFIVDRMGWEPQERHSRLAKILEEKSGNRGLTIVCY